MKREAVLAEVRALLPKAQELADNYIVGGQEELAALARCLADQPEFQVPGGLYISPGMGGTNFIPEMACRPLLKIAAERGGEGAVDWLAKLLGGQCGSVRLTTEVHGMGAPPGGIAIGDVLFVPWSEQPVTPSSQFHGDFERRLGGGSFPPSAVAICTLPDVAVPVDQERLNDAARVAPFEKANMLVRATAQALTASVNQAWSLGRSWSEFEDPDLQVATFGFSWNDHQGEAPPALGSTVLTDADVEFAKRYLSLGGDLRRKLDIASARLNLARRRRSLGDKALEAAIAFEAMLGDGTTDLSYKLRLRAAHLVGGDADARVETMKLVGKFYGIRSQVVHGTAADAKPDASDTVQQALVTCAEVLKRIVAHGNIPDWPKVEVSGQL